MTAINNCLSCACCLLDVSLHTGNTSGTKTGKKKKKFCAHTAYNVMQWLVGQRNSHKGNNI